MFFFFSPTVPTDCHKSQFYVSGDQMVLEKNVLVYTNRKPNRVPSVWLSF